MADKTLREVVEELAKQRGIKLEGLDELPDHVKAYPTFAEIVARSKIHEDGTIELPLTRE